MQMSTQITIQPTDRLIWAGWQQNVARFHIEDAAHLLTLCIAREQLPRLLTLVQEAMVAGIGHPTDSRR